MKLRRLFIVVALLAVGLAVRASLIKVGPDEIGVRTLNFGADHGIVDHDYGPGYHRNIWLFDTWNRFPSYVQRIRFGKEGGSSIGRSVGELQLTSADGDRVLLTLEVVYRIANGRAHFVLQDSGAGNQYEGVVRNLAQDAARVLFGKLRTESFYSESDREKCRQDAIVLLRDRLSQRGIELADLLLENVEFDPNYENLIKQKKIADQQVELEKAKAFAAEETGKVTRIKVESTVKVQKVDRETEAEMTRLRTETDLQAAVMVGEASRYASQRGADASLYESHKKADGDRLVKLAQAEGTQQINIALAGEGGQNLVALEAAKSLKLADVTFPSFGFEWFNPHEMARRLGGTDGRPIATTAPAEVSAR